MRFERLAGRKVVIWGAGREGRAAQEELAAAGIVAEMAVTGGGAVPDDLSGRVVTGAEAIARLHGADVVIKSPGIARTNEDYQRLVSSGVEVTSLMALWLRENSQRAIGVTGTKGKSTTATVVEHVLRAAGLDAVLVGNVGTPVTAEAAAHADVAVAEVSSYQAADIDVSPKIAVVTSLYPEHLPWHGGFDQYVHDKLNLVAHGAETVVVPANVPELELRVRSRAAPETQVVTPTDFGILVSASGVEWSGAGEVRRAELPLQGDHNVGNIALALAAAAAFCRPDATAKAAMMSSLPRLRPLAHRLERLPSDDAKVWVDDGLATAPEAVVAALRTFDGSRVLLIAGGADRGLSFAPLVNYLAGRAGADAVTVALVGPAGRRLHTELVDVDVDARLAPDFATALTWAKTSRDAEVVLLSPGAPSFDEFTSYEERSAAFARAALGGPVSDAP